MKNLTIFVIILAILALIPINSFSGGIKEGKTESGTGHPLEFYVWGFMPDRIKEVCNRFESLNNEKINIHVTPNIGYIPALQSKIMGGARMDAMYTYQHTQLRWYHAGWAADLTDLPGAKELKDDIIDSVKPTYISPEGKLIGVPFYLTAHVNFYNKRLLKEAGWNEFPKSKEEIYQLCKKLKANGVESPYVAYWVQDYIDRMFFVYLMSEGIQTFDKDFNPTFQNNPETQKVLEWWVKMYREGLTSPTILTDDLGALEAMMVSGKSAIYNMHHYFLKNIVLSGGKESGNIVLAPWEPGKTGVTLQDGDAIQMGGRSPDPERAWRFVKYYGWKDPDGKYYVPSTWAFNGGSVMPYKGWFSDPAVKSHYTDWIDFDLLKKIIFDGSKAEQARLMTIWYPDWTVVLNPLLHKMLLGEIPVKDVITEIANLAQKLKNEAE